MKQIPPIKSVMTAFPQCVESMESLDRALELMEGKGLRRLPVVEDDRPIGLLTDVQIRREREKQRQEDASPPPCVRDLCRAAPHIVELTEPLDVVLLQMAKSQADAALVVKEGRLVGIFTKTDACRSFGELLRSLFPRDHDDDAA